MCRPRRVRLVSLWVVSLVAALLWPGGVSAQQASVDYDTDDDGLIEISNLDQLNAVRWDKAGDGLVLSGNSGGYSAAFPRAEAQQGCPAVCEGYELAGDLNFDTDGDGEFDSGDSFWNNGAGWPTIGGTYEAIFDGNGHTISNLFINRTDTNAGLFARLGSGAEVRHLSLTGADVTLSSSSGDYHHAGVLAAVTGPKDGGDVLVVGVHVEGEVELTNGHASTVKGVGLLSGRDTGSRIVASHVEGSVSATGAKAWAGGMIGRLDAGTEIVASYAVADFTTTNTDQGGSPISRLVTGATATHTYFDSTVFDSTVSTLVDLGSPKTTAQLQTPTDYDGIYADWDNLDVDDDGTADTNDFWDFGTTSDYPELKGPETDYDTDDDGLIEISSLAQLDAIRWDLNGDGAPTGSAADKAAHAEAFPNPLALMGCPPGATGGCLGYELKADLDFDTDSNGEIGSGDDYWNGGSGWAPIGAWNGGSGTGYSATFQGNGHSISGLHGGGLFDYLERSGKIYDVQLLDVDIESASEAGALAVHNSGLIVGAYADGRVTSTSSQSGQAGMLVGRHQGTIIASYAAGTVTSPHVAGGLVGLISGTFSDVVASYAVVWVNDTDTTTAGGLVGQDTATYGDVTDSYWNSDVPGTGSEAGGTGQTTAALQTPTGYTGIYADWDNIDIDGDGTKDPEDTNDFWRFGTDSQYPYLHYQDSPPAGVPAPVDYDTDDDGLIEVHNLAQLDAIRWDNDGGGTVTADSRTYNRAFPYRRADMGCPQMTGLTGGCTGYELEADLDFDTDGSGRFDAGDDFWDGGAGWKNLGRYHAEFNGNGHSISNLYISRVRPVLDSTTYQEAHGLFGRADAGAVIRDLALLDVYVHAKDSDAAGLVGVVADATILGVYVQGYIELYTTGVDAFRAGLVAASFAGRIVAAHTSGSVHGRTAGSSTTPNLQAYIGGLVGGAGGGHEISASYSNAEILDEGVSHAGGLVGRVQGSGAINNSYWDRCRSGMPTSAGGEAKTTRELTSPAGYTGIYADWDNLDVDGDGTAATLEFWGFGNAAEYPYLKAAAGGQGTGQFQGPAVWLCKPHMQITEGGSDTYTARLGVDPGQAITVTPRSDRIVTTVSPASLTFDSSNWQTEQTFTVTGVHDADKDDESDTVTHNATGGWTASKVRVSVEDDDKPPSVYVTITPQSLSLSEGGSRTYTAVLTGDPGGAVTVTPSSSDTGAVTVSPASLAFNSSNWSTSKTVRVIAAQDADPNDESVSISHPVEGIPRLTAAPSVAVIVDDDETSSLTLSRGSVPSDATTPLTATLRAGPANTPMDLSITCSPAIADLDGTTRKTTNSSGSATWDVSVGARFVPDDVRCTVKAQAVNNSQTSYQATLTVEKSSLGDFGVLALSPKDVATNQSGVAVRATLSRYRSGASVRLSTFSCTGIATVDIPAAAATQTTDATGGASWDVTVDTGSTDGHCEFEAYDVSRKEDVAYAALTVGSPSASALPDPPGAPDAPRVDAVTVDSLTFSWDLPTVVGSGLVVGYRLKFRQSGAADYTYVPSASLSSQLAARTYTFTGLSSSTDYEVQVSAVDHYGLHSDWSPMTSATTATPPVPYVPYVPYVPGPYTPPGPSGPSGPSGPGGDDEESPRTTLSPEDLGSGRCPTEVAPFVDVSRSSVAAWAIDCIWGLGVTVGKTATTYGPEDPVVRSQMAAFLTRLWRMAGYGCFTDLSPFTDVGSDYWAAAYIGCIHGLGVTVGKTATTYAPEDSISRAEMAAFLARIWRKSGDECSPGPAPFEDVRPDHWAAAYIDCIHGIGLTIGKTATTYAPEDLVTRAEMALFLARLWNILEWSG